MRGKQRTSLHEFDLTTKKCRYDARLAGFDVPKRRPNPVEPQPFSRFVDKSGDCWLWTGTRHPKGYGLYFHHGQHRAHRWAWSEVNGPIPEGLSVCHHCDNPRCVRPDHLFLGTHGDNNRDRAAKGRSAKGEQSGTAKLTEAAVAEIRRLHTPLRKTGPYSTSALARRFGVHPSMIRYIVRKECWR